MKTSKRTAIAILLVPVFLACQEDDSPWNELASFSEALTIGSSTFQETHGYPAVREVDTIEIYRLKDDNTHPTVRSLRHESAAYRSRDPVQISSILQSAAHQVPTDDDCLNDSSGARFFVAAYDVSESRVGSFRSQICQVNSGRFATVRPTGGAAIYLSRDLAEELERLGLYPSQR